MIRVQAEPFDEAEAFALRRNRTDIGGLACFVGYVRDFTAAQDVDYLELQHYPGFTEAAIKRIVQDAGARFDILDSLVIHRYGRLVPSDPIVLVSVAARHRDAAFDAARYIMDWLKTEAPFWKKEGGSHGARWIEPYTDDYAATENWRTQGKADAK